MKSISDFLWDIPDSEDEKRSQIWPLEQLSRPIREGDDSSYGFTRQSRSVEWWDEKEVIEPIQEMFLESKRAIKNFVSIEDVWSGRVLESSRDYFIAKLSDEEFRHSDRIVKIWKNKIDHSLLADIQEGASFKWSFGKRYTGVLEEYQKMSFKPRLNINADDMDRMVMDMIQGFEDIFSESDEDET